MDDHNEASMLGLRSAGSDISIVRVTAWRFGQKHVRSFTPATAVAS